MRQYEFCSCWRVLTVSEAISDINDEMKEFIEAKTDKDKADEKSDVIWGFGRLLGAKSGIHYVEMDGDELHYQKITERMNEYSCIRSYKKRCTKDKEMQMNKLALIDIDGTLVSATEFDESKAKMPEYINYWNEQTMNAEVFYEGIKQLKRLHALGYVLIVLTARDTTCKPFTVKKLKEMGVYHMITGIWHRPVAMNGLAPSHVKNVLIPRIENRYKNKFVVAMEDSNHAIMKKHNIVVIDANTYNTR